MQKWKSTAGKIITNRVNKQISALLWKGKTQREITDHGVQEFVPMCGEHSPACIATMDSIGNKFDWTITPDNHKELSELLVLATKNLVIPEKDVRTTPEEREEMARERNERMAKQEEQARLDAIEKDEAIAELRQQYPWAIADDGTMAHQVRAAKNIREELKRAFPGIKFSVKSDSYSMGDSVDVAWDLGPTSDEVRDVIGKYNEGYFDGMQDMYCDDNSPRGRAIDIVLGRSKHVMGQRHIPDDTWELLGKMLCEKQHVEYDGRYTERVFGPNDTRNLNAHLNDLFGCTNFPVGATITGLEYDNSEYSGYKIVFEVPEVQSVPDVEKSVSGVEIQKHFHTKRNCDFWIVVLKERVERDEFERLRDVCKDMGGWYSHKFGRTPGGYAFLKEETAKQFSEKIAGSENVQSSSSESPASSENGNSNPLAEKFEEMADDLQDKIDERRRPMTQNPTPKRLREYNSRVFEGNDLERLQRALRALAKGWRENTLPDILRNLRTKTAILPLVHKGIRSEGYYTVVQDSEYYDKSPIAVSLQNLMEGTKTEEDRAAENERARLEKIRKMEDELRFLKIDGYFPTPRPVVEEMLDAADVDISGKSVLEPSAGNGAICDVVREKYPDSTITCFEIRPSLRNILTEKGYRLHDTEDFLAEKVNRESYDVVLMNPPFEQNQDADHVRHAFDFVRPGGKLVALMGPSVFSSTRSKAENFRTWLDSQCHNVIDLNNKFSGPECFRSTGVVPKIVVIEK